MINNDKKVINKKKKTQSLFYCLRCFCLTSLLLISLLEIQSIALEPPKWNMELLSIPPVAVEASEGKVAGLQSFYLDGLPYKGRPTKFYAYLGLPSIESGKVPAVVLVHGGGGTAFADWVKYWNNKGYARMPTSSRRC
jgi:hypothetical protein